VSALAVLGVVAVPAIRALRTKRKLRKLTEGGIALAILGAAGGVGFIWIWWAVGFVEALTTRHATYHPPTWLLWLVAAAGGFQVASSLNTVMKWTAPVTRAVANHVSRVSLVLGAIGGTLAVYAAKDVLVPAVNDWGMKTVVALLAFAVPIGLALYLRLPEAVVREVRAAREEGRKRRKR
jgi:NADPH:quinone reductase-like Zn-dependent oxidoreductase